MSDQATNEGTEMSADEGSELHGCPLVDSRGQEVLHVPRDRYTEVLRALTDEGYAMCVDLTAVDYSQFMDRDLPEGIEPERFEVG